MKGCRKCHPELKVGDSVYYMKEVNKGAQKIMTAIPDQLAVLFTWTVLTVVFVFFLVMSAYLVLRFELSAKPMFRSGEPAISVPSALYAQKPPAVVNVTAREFCTTVSKDLYSLELIGYVDTDRRVSKLTGLDIGAGDVHFVFTNQTYVSWLSTCSLESVVRSIGNSGRVNVFVVSGIEFERPLFTNGQNKIRPVSLTSSLTELTIKYGSDRLNVVRVNLEECLECSPYQGMDLSKRPAMAKYIVQLVLLWQFGGTVLDPGVVAVRGDVYRATDTAVLYGDRTMSSPVACHAFVYDMMLCAKNYALDNRTFGPNSARRIVEKAVGRAERSVKEARPVADGTVCRGGGGAVGGRCFYVEPERTAAYDADSFVHSFCPVVSRPVAAFPRPDYSGIASSAEWSGRNRRRQHVGRAANR